MGSRLFNVISKEPEEEKYTTVGVVWENESTSGKPYRTLSVNVEAVQKELAKPKNGDKEWVNIGLFVENKFQDQGVPQDQ